MGENSMSDDSQRVGTGAEGEVSVIRLSSQMTSQARSSKSKPRSGPSFWGRFFLGLLVGTVLIGTFVIGYWNKVVAQEEGPQKQIALALQAAPYIEAAITQTVPELYRRAKADRTTAGEMLSMGLSISAGRTDESLFSAADVAVMRAYRARLEQALKAVPLDKQEAFVKDFPLNDAEKDTVIRNQDKLSSNYWLSRADQEMTQKEIETSVPAADGKSFVAKKVRISETVLPVGLVTAAQTCVEYARAHETAVQLIRLVIHQSAHDNTQLNPEQRDRVIRDQEAQLAALERKMSARVEVACGGIDAYARYQPFFRKQAQTLLPLESVKQAVPNANKSRLKPGERLTQKTGSAHFAAAAL